MSNCAEKQLICIDSRLRLGGSSSAFSYDLGLRPNNGFTHMALMQASIPKTFFTVPSAGATVTLTELGVSVIITIMAGNWDRNSFSAGTNSIAELLTSASAGLGHNWVYTCTYPLVNGPDQGKYTYAVTGNSGQPSFTFGSNSIAAILMGFESSATYDFAGDSLESAIISNMQTIAAVQVHISIAGSQGGSASTGNGFTAPKGDILQTIVANSGSSFYSNILFQQFDLEGNSRELSSNSSSVVNVYLTDSNGNSIDLNGAPMVLDVILYKKNAFWEMARGVLRMLSYMFSTGIGIPVEVATGPTGAATPAEAPF